MFDVPGHRPSGHAADGLASHIVLGWSDPTGEDYRIGASKRLLDGKSHSVQVVTHGYLEVRVKSFVVQAGPKECHVGVDDLADQQFRADGDDFDDHSMTGLVMVPIPSIETSTTSPAFR